MTKHLLIFIVSAMLSICMQAQQLQPVSDIDSNIAVIDSAGNVHFRAEIDINDLPAIETAAKQIVIDFNNYLSKLWHQWTETEKKDFTLQELDSMKEDYERSTLDLFIAKAEKYVTSEESRYLVRDGYYIDRKNIKRLATNPIKDGKVMREVVMEDIEHRPAIIEITNRQKKTNIQREVIKYLKNVKNLTVYKKVVFKAGGFTVTNIKKNANGKFECTVCYHQQFSGIRRDGGRYGDDTYRCITVHIEPIIQHTKDGTMIYWDLKLGDVNALETT